jgi:rabenosyn-5
MSGRRLGGGRILGSGKGLAPAASSAVSFRVGSPFAASEATPSLNNSSLGSSPASGQPPTSSHDLISKISLEEPSGNSKTEPSGLLCPICNEEMVRRMTYRLHTCKLEYHTNLKAVDPSATQQVSSYLFEYSLSICLRTF